MSLYVVILAAGQGTRMRSPLPKVLHPIAGVPMLERVLQCAMALGPTRLFVVCGHGSNTIRRYCQHYPVDWIEQKEQLGTGHAVRQVLPALKDPNARVLVLYGDMPLIQAETLQHFLSTIAFSDLGLLTGILDDPTGFGRIVRNLQGQIIQIIEEKDATPEQRAIKEINSGVYLTSAANLHRWVPQIKPHNAQQEFYLTDIVEFARKENTAIFASIVKNSEEIQGINDKKQLSQLERYYQLQQAQRLLSAGVTIMDPSRFDLRGKATIAPDVTIDVNVILEGKVTIACGTTIGANCVLRNVSVGKNVDIKPNCVIEEAVIGDYCKIGPFARIRPETVLANNVSIGNFVEIKKSQVGIGSKIPHLSYVGDAIIGEHVNIGAGAITCNYDGINKHQTIIGNRVFIGSDSQLIAPIHIEDGAFIGAGSTITKNVPANKLTISRAKQQTIDHWIKPMKKEDD